MNNFFFHYVILISPRCSTRWKCRDIDFPCSWKTTEAREQEVENLGLIFVIPRSFGFSPRDLSLRLTLSAWQSRETSYLGRKTFQGNWLSTFQSSWDYCARVILRLVEMGCRARRECTAIKRNYYPVSSRLRSNGIYARHDGFPSVLRITVQFFFD